MAAKKRVRKANPKRSSGGRKNPIFAINAKTGKTMQFFKDSEIEGIQKKAKELAESLVASVPSKYSAAEKGLIASVAGSYYLPGKSVTKKSIDSLVKKLDADAPFVDGSSKAVLTKVKNRLNTILAQQTGIASSKAKIKALGQMAKDVKSKRSQAAMKKLSLKNIELKDDLDAANLTIADLEQIASNMKSGNPRKGGKKMAAKKKKKIGKKKSVKRKVSKKKSAGKKKTAGRKKSTSKRRTKRKIRIGYSKATNTALLKSEKAARKQLSKRGKKKGSLSTKRKVRVQWQRMNPLIPERASMKETAVAIAKIAAAGAAAGVLLQVGNKFAKPMFDKILPKAITDLKVGNVAVGQIALSCVIPGLLGAGLKMLKNPYAQTIADVVLVTTFANAGQRIAAGLLPSGMAGVEPMLMGVEPQLMGEADFGAVQLHGDADFGDADFGDADFGDADFGAIEEFSGVEPQLMGSADFGSIEQFSGHDAASLGAIQMHGDEDYAGEDDMDGESDFGLG